MEGALPDKIPPQSLEAEQAVLGAMLLERDAIGRVVTMLEPADFYRDAHRSLFGAMVALYNEGQAVDLVTLGERLRDRKQLDQCGGLPYLTDLLEAVPTSANVERYAGIVREKAILRNLIRNAHELVGQAYDPVATADMEGFMAAAEAKIRLAAGRDAADDQVGIGDALAEVVADIETRRENGASIRGLPTGLWELDRKLSGLCPGRLYVVGARTGIGKTALVCNWLSHLSVDMQLPCALFSMEMARDGIAARLLAIRTGINSRQIESGQVSESWLEQLRAVRDDVLATGRLQIFDRGAVTLDYIRAKSRRMAASAEGLRAIFVDYLQLITVPEEREIRLRVTAAAWGLKNLAKELGVPVVAISSMARGANGSEPTMAQLKESGDVEGTADAVMLLHRSEEEPRTLHILLPKQRFGPTGSVRAEWVPECQRVLPLYGGGDDDEG